MSESRRVTARDLGDEIFGQLEIPLRAGHADVAQIGREGGEPAVQRGLLPIPQGQAEDGKRVPLMPVPA